MARQFAVAAGLCAFFVALAACASGSVSQAAAGEADRTKAGGLPANPLTSQDGSIKGGHCSAALPKPAKVPWRHKVSSTSVTLLGAPNHRLRDVIALPGQATKMRARLTYGTVDKDLEDENVDLYLQKCPGWGLVASGRTDDDGVVWFDLPANLPPGDYRVRAIVQGDGSVADGTLAVWPKGVKVVVSDVDGTLTTSDWQLFKDVATKAPAAMYADADKAIQAWSGKGYRVVYLTGRPQLFSRYSRNWLDAHKMPQGVLRLTDDAGDAVPSEAGVQAFKTQVLKDLIASHGAQIRAGHGNAVTDIGAYQAAGIPNADLYIVGPHAGVKGTTKVESYTKLLPALAKYPGAAQP